MSETTQLGKIVALFSGLLLMIVLWVAIDFTAALTAVAAIGVLTGLVMYHAGKTADLAAGNPQAAGRLDAEPSRIAERTDGAL